MDIKELCIDEETENKETKWLIDYVVENDMQWIIEESKTIMEVHNKLLKVKKSVRFEMYCVGKHLEIIGNELLLKLGLPK